MTPRERPGERREIEFLDADGGPGELEDLAAPEPRLSPRARVLIAFGAGLLLLAGLAVRIGSSGGSELRVAVPTSVPTSAPTAVPVTAPPPGAPADPPELAPAGARGGTSDCPYAAVCESDAAVPTAVRESLRAIFPDARATSVYSLNSSRRGSSTRLLETREVTARAGVARILIQIRRAQPTDVTGARVVDPGPGVVRAARQLRGYYVSVQESFPPDRNVSTKAVAALAGDPRLLAV